MASPYQQESFQRKLIYLGLIVVLFTVSFLFRRYGVEAKADELALREQNQGEVELTGSAVRLMLTGSRGLVICVLWNNAIEKQKRNQWNELEMIVRSVTKLQPHFIRPWLHQSWNLSYNVSVECHDMRDMYFYMTRGIDLLAQGERQNRNNPEMRYSIGFYTQHKIMQHDKTATLRSMLQLSCVDPEQRDPARFQVVSPEDGRVLNLKEAGDYVAAARSAMQARPNDADARRRYEDAQRALDVARRNFEDFCREHPQLIHRLHDGLRMRVKDERIQFRCRTPDEVVQFLADNRKLPSIYEDRKETGRREGDSQATPLKPPEQRFPLLPPPETPGLRPGNPPPPAEQVQFMFDGGRALNWDSPLGDHIDAHMVARGWFAYAQEALPPPSKMPGQSEPITNRIYQRNAPFTTMIFRNLPCRSQSFVGERLAEEGWFDAGWLVPDYFPGNRFSNNEPAVIGGGQRWTQEAWQDASRMWTDYGRRTNILISQEEEQQKRAEAEAFMRALGLKWSDMPPPLRPEDRDKPELVRGQQAYEFLHMLGHYRTLSNFMHHYLTAQVEADPETIRARSLFFDAVQLRLEAKDDQSIKKFEEAFPAWKKILIEHPEFGNDSSIQEDTYELQLRYLSIIRRLHGAQFRRLQALGTFLGQSAARPALAPDWLGLAVVSQAHALPPPDIKGPLDEEVPVGKDGKETRPLIRKDIRYTVHNRYPSLVVKPDPPPEIPQMGPGGRIMPGMPGMRMPGPGGAELPQPPPPTPLPK